MAMKEYSHNSHSPQTRLSEAEVSQLLQEATQQYEEYMRLADLADITKTSEEIEPKYAWDNPIGLVVSKR